MVIGKRIKEMRESKQITQEQLGLIIDVTKVSICGYEKGHKNPNLSTLIKLADYFEVSTDFLLGRDINVINEDEGTYQVSISREDLKILEALKKSKPLYSRIIEEPSRMIDYLTKQVK